MIANEQFDAEQARVIAKEAVREILVQFGLDSDEPREMQADFLFLRRQRLAGEAFREAFRRNFVATVWSIAAAAIIGFAGWLIASMHWFPTR